MSDVRLRRLLGDIMRCETKEEKVRLIRSHVFSLHDYLDLLESDCLCGDEYDALYAAYGDMELAILCKIVFYEQLRSGFADLHGIVLERKEAERDWQNHLIDFLKRLNASRIRMIDAMIGNIDYEEIKFYWARSIFPLGRVAVQRIRHRLRQQVGDRRAGQLLLHRPLRVFVKLAQCGPDAAADRT